MFITFEGIDGSGKSTQIKSLKEKLESTTAEVEIYRDPGGAPVSEKVRDILLKPKYEVNPVTELLLFSASRSQLMAEKILPCLDEGKIVILDRFYDSTTAYQGYGRGAMPLEKIYELNVMASHNRAPDLTFYMDIPYKEAKKRMANKHKDRMEQAGEDFYKKVINGFRHLAEREARIFTVDATGPASAVRQQIWDQVLQRLGQN